MTESKNIAETTKPAGVAAAGSNAILRPPVDICEDADGISLWADMPGVGREGLDIQVDKDTLSIEGEAKLAMPEGIKPLYAEVRSTRYSRSFALSSELDTTNIEASIKDGVLFLRIHKRPESRPRKIEIQAG